MTETPSIIEELAQDYDRLTDSDRKEIRNLTASQCATAAAAHALEPHKAGWSDSIWRSPKPKFTPVVGLGPITTTIMLIATAIDRLDLADSDPATSRAFTDIADERENQKTIGYDTANDDEYTNNQLATAAACYAIMAAKPGATSTALALWPWPAIHFKPRCARENLVRAGALAVAELERTRRAAKTREDAIRETR